MDPSFLCPPRCFVTLRMGKVEDNVVVDDLWVHLADLVSDGTTPVMPDQDASLTAKG